MAVTELTKKHLILTNPNEKNGDLSLFVGDPDNGSYHVIDIRKQILWLRLISNSISRYLEKNV